MRISLIGTGNVAGALGRRLAALEGSDGQPVHEVLLGSRDPGNRQVGGPAVASLQDAVEHGDLVINATPGELSTAILTPYARALAGKVLVDLAVGFTGQGQVCPPGLGREVQAALPDTHVVKSLCTTTAAVMADPGLLETSSTVFLSGDSSAAKDLFGEVLADLGWAREDQMDLGGITTADDQEGYIPLYVAITKVLGTHNVNIKVVLPRDGESV